MKEKMHKYRNVHNCSGCIINNNDGDGDAWKKKCANGVEEDYASIS